MTEESDTIDPRPRLTKHLEVSGFPLSRCDFTPKILRIRILYATNLMKKDVFGTTDPYCKISLYKNIRSSSVVGKSVQSKTMKKTLNPYWNEEFKFRVNMNENRLVVEVYDENRMTRDDFLGIISIHLPQLNIGTEKPANLLAPKSFKLRPRSSRSSVRGNLIIYLAYIPENVDPLLWSPNPDDNREEPPVDNEFSIGQDDAQVSEGMPNGWEERVDQNGRIYYVDHNNKRTQWEKPNHFNRLPEGWEERTDLSGRVYYVDHVNQKTQWEHPGSKLGGAIPIPDVSAPSSPVNNQPTTSTDAPRPQNKTNLTNSPKNTNTTQQSSGVNSSTPNTTNTHEPSRTSETLSQFHSGRNSDQNEAATMYLRRRQISHEDTIPRGANNPEEVNGTATNSASPKNKTKTTNQTAPTNASDSLRVKSTTEPTIAPPPLNITTNSPESNKSKINNDIRNINTDGLQIDDDDDQLPPGWQMAITPNGRRFFINHNDKTTTWEDPRTARRGRTKSVNEQASGSQNQFPAPNAVNRNSSRDDLLFNLGPLPPGWEEREHTDGRIFYVNHNARTTQWEDPRLTKFSGPAVPYSRNYKQKYDYFRSKLRAPREPNTKFELRINRKTIFEDSYRIIYNVKKIEMLKYKLWIEFIGEKGLDYGGVQREWFFLVSREMFNPYYALFEYSAQDNYTLQINPLSGMANENHLKYFKFIGRVAGMAVYHGRLLDGFFIRPFYKMMLGKKISLKDMEPVDMEYYRSLRFILENDPGILDLTFSVDEERYGTKVEIDLMPNGRNVEVTNQNKRQYIECIINWRFVKRVESQMSAFLEGFQDVIPLSTLQIFDANELELLLCGLQDINVIDWKANTHYKGEYNPNHPVIVNFWKTVYTFNNELRARLLQFVTGTSRVPMNGFVELWGSTGPQKFTIEKWGNSDQLPRAHTCFNRLDLPPYATFQDLRKKLLTAIENAEGFEGVD